MQSKPEKNQSDARSKEKQGGKEVLHHLVLITDRWPALSSLECSDAPASKGYCCFLLSTPPRREVLTISFFSNLFNIDDAHAGILQKSLCALIKRFSRE